MIEEKGIPQLVEQIKYGTDFYIAVASQMFRKSPSDVTTEERFEAKERILKALYGVE